MSLSTREPCQCMRPEHVKQVNSSTEWANIACSIGIQVYSTLIDRSAKRTVSGDLAPPYLNNPRIFCYLNTLLLCEACTCMSPRSMVSLIGRLLRSYRLHKRQKHPLTYRMSSLRFIFVQSILYQSWREGQELQCLKRTLISTCNSRDMHIPKMKGRTRTSKFEENLKFYIQFSWHACQVCRLDLATFT